MAEIKLPAPLVPLGYEQITSLVASVGLTVPAGAWIADIQADPTAAVDVRYRADGTAPEAAIGAAIQSATTQRFIGRALLQALRFIEEGASAKLNVHYYGG